MLAQCGPEGGLATYDAWRNGPSSAAYKKAFAERGAEPFLARRVPDGRRNAVQWPTVASI